MNPEPEKELLPAERLAEIKARAEAATEGPWTNDPPLPSYRVYGAGGRKAVADMMRPDSRCRDNDGTFIAHARTDIPALLAHIEALSPLPSPGWRPISEAPRDGASIIAWKPGWVIPYLANWTPDKFVRLPHPHWHMRGAGCTWSRRPENQPTMFMPLPPPPTEPAPE